MLYVKGEAQKNAVKKHVPIQRKYYRNFQLMMNFKSRTLAAFLCIVFGACLAIAVEQIKAGRGQPAIAFATPEFFNRECALPVTVQGNGPMILGKNLHIAAVQGKTRFPITPRTSSFDEGNGTLRMEIFPADVPELTDGEIKIEVSARNKPANGLLEEFFTTWAKHSVKFSVDLTPPAAAFALSPPAITRGGAALLVITPSEKLNGLRLSRKPHGYGLAQVGPQKYVALLAFPQDLPAADCRLSLEMTDRAGNSSLIEFVPPIEDFTFRADPIRLNDKFFTSKYQEFKNYTGTDSSAVGLFLLMNRDVRKSSYEELRALCGNSGPEKLWQGAFLEMPNATRRSEFADRRDYIHKGKVIDRQVHLGLDYASVTKDNIPAANSGIVLFTGYLGIHGNAVLIDHGLGLFSLYSHLSSIQTTQGLRVEKGQIIGRTGSTGMAGGDHLHFEILVNGISVNPDFFFNAEWLEQNIDAPLAALTETGND